MSKVVAEQMGKKLEESESNRKEKRKTYFRTDLKPCASTLVSRILN